MNSEKHIKVTGYSNISWKDAIVKTIAEASKTIDYLSSVKVLEQKAKIDGNKISEYFVDFITINKNSILCYSVGEPVKEFDLDGTLLREHDEFGYIAYKSDDYLVSDMQSSDARPGGLLNCFFRGVLKQIFFDNPFQNLFIR